MNTIKRCVWLLLCLPALCMQANNTLVGRVVDEMQQPVSFASVYVEDNPMKGTVTDADGVFALDSITSNDKIIISFIGYKTIEMRIKKVPADTLLIEMQEQPILLRETEIQKEKKYVSKRRQKKNLLNDVYAQLLHDFPDEYHFYKVVSDYAIYNENQIAAFEELSGNVIEMPGKGRKGQDSIQLKPIWVKRHRHPDTNKRLSNLETQLRKEKNAERMQLVDSSALIHRVLWGGDIKWMFKELKGKVSKWESAENDSILVLTYREDRNFLGIIKFDLELHLVLDPYSYRIQKQSQSLVVEANIPFGYKLNADQLAILNVVNLTADDIEKFRLKKVFADVKRNIIYETTNNEVFVEEKNVISKIRMEDNKQRKLDFHQTALMKVLSASTSGVIPYTKEQLQQPYELILQ
ncbi:MAG: carboxypeptidase-like regulatory domain-containing protein [Paludibacteraceae bacterium]|nr:carboxypeptidase-like regulatory domain-containing protein [Paludibacteraceae bacterium]